MSSNLENLYFKLLKRIMLLVLGSGLLTNALYIYGLGYYEGFIERLGFEFYLFPIDWDEAILWTYTASRDFGENSIIVLGKTSPYIFLSLLPAFYFLVRVWMHISKPKHGGPKSKEKLPFKFKFARKAHRLKKNKLFVYRFIFTPINWLLLKEQSFFAFFASYFFMIFLLFIPIFIIVWVLFPVFGFNHGESVAEKRWEWYQESLCGDESSYWSRCIKFNVDHLSKYEVSGSVSGRVVIKKDRLVGVITESGPMVLSMPADFFYNTERNPCFEKGCKEN